MQSPYMGWVVPREWQEPGSDDDLEGQETEQWDDCDGDPDFTL